MADTTLTMSLPTGWDAYALERNEANEIWNGAAWVPYNLADLASYAQAGVESPPGSGFYVFPFPLTAPPGNYTWTIYKQLGGTPASGDAYLGSGGDFWNGTSFGSSSASGGGQAIVAVNEILTQPLGTDKSYTLTLRYPDGSINTSYSGDETLVCRIWSGQDQLTLAAPAIAWIDATEGTVAITVTALDVEDLGIGLYRMQATVGDGGTVAALFDGSIQLTPSPGIVAAALTLCTYHDMLLYAPQIQRLQDTRTELAGFLGERARARTCTLERILDGYRPNYGRARRGLSADGSGPGPHLRWVTEGPAGEPTPDHATLREALDLGGLMVTHKLRAANAHLAAAIVFLNQPGRDNPYHQQGAYHQEQGMALIAEAVVEVDLSDPLDGIADVRIGQDVTWLR